MTSNRLYWRDKPLTCRVTRDDSRDDCGCCKLFRVDVLAGIGGPVLHTDWLRYPAGSSGYRVEDGERVIEQFVISKLSGMRHVPGDLMWLYRTCKDNVSGKSGGCVVVA